MIFPFLRHEHSGTLSQYVLPPKDGKDKKGRYFGLKLLPFEDMPGGVPQMDVEVQSL